MKSLDNNNKNNKNNNKNNNNNNNNNLIENLDDNNIESEDNGPKTSEELYSDYLKEFEFDINNFKLKIIDLGNTEFVNEEKIQDEIMIRNYRPPENIMNDYFNEKADIWCLGCIAFELLTYDYLFELDEDTKNKNETYRDRLHLKQMFEILGKMPKNLIYNCDFNEDLFDNKCNILKMKNIEANSLENILIEEYEYSDETTQEICTFLRKLLEYDINKRYSAKDAYNDLCLN